MTSPRPFRVVAPTRLHFGLLAIGEGAGASGGAGVMLAEPNVVVSVRPSDRFRAQGFHAERLARIADRWAAGRETDLPEVELLCESAPPEHIGLGLGTQLALAAAVALDRSRRFDSLASCGETEADRAELAALVGRGQRSGIGVRGFFLGGFLAEDIKRDGQALAPLRRRLDVPESWRFVLVRERGNSGAHGPTEERHFRSLPPTPVEATERMRRRLFDELVPAVEASDFDAFAEAAYAFGRASGELFRGAQSGTYASEFAECLVDDLRGRGLRGVGQSSWGPTLWVAAPDPDAAEAIADDLRGRYGSADVDVTIGVPSSCGARVVSEASDRPVGQASPDDAANESLGVGRVLHEVRDRNEPATK